MFAARTMAVVVGAAAVVAGPALAAHAAPGASFVSFSAFIADVSRADFSAASRSGRAGEVRSVASFNRMRSYVLDLYKGVKVEHSYEADGQYFDCVSIASQPGVRALRGKPIAVPPSPVAVGLQDRAAAGSAAASPRTVGAKDRFGNAVSCRPGTVPMHRLSWERVTKFATLDAFLAKRDGARRIAAQATREYAYGRQTVNNRGGSSWLNLWNPTANFSISQQWYSTVKGATSRFRNLQMWTVCRPEIIRPAQRPS